MSLIEDAKRSTRGKPSVRVQRPFFFFGKKTAVLHFPASVGSALTLLPLESVRDSRIYVSDVPALTNGTPSPATAGVFAVMTSARPEPIMIMHTEAEAADVVKRLSGVIAPNRMKWIWAVLGIFVAYQAVGAIVRSPPPSTASPQLSIYTPMAPSAAAAPARVTPSAGGVLAQAGSAPEKPALDAATSAGSSATGGGAQGASPVADQGDPFGLKLAPPAK